jgi:hypothetical protein
MAPKLALSFSLATFASLAASTAFAAEPVLVFVLAGQSNMVGRGNGLPESPDPLPPELASQPGIRYDHYNPAARSPADNGNEYVNATSTDWGPLEPKGTSRRYGPELTFGRALAAALPGRDIAIVKMALDGTNLREHWVRNPLGEPTLGLGPDTDLLYKSQLYHALMGAFDSATYAGATALAYPAEVTRLDHALERLARQGLAYELGAVVWMQGENEANSTLANAQKYGAWLSSLVSAMRQDLGAPGLRFVIGRVSDNLYAANGGPVPAERSSSVDAVRAAQEALAAADPYVGMIDTDDLPPRPGEEQPYNFHFDSVGYRTMGERFASAFLALPTPPDGPGGAAGQGGAGGAGPGGAGGSGPGGEGGRGGVAGATNGAGTSGTGPAAGAGRGGAAGSPAGPGSSGGPNGTAKASGDDGDDGGCSYRGGERRFAAVVAALAALAALGRRRRG